MSQKKNQSPEKIHMFAFLGTGKYQPCTYSYPEESAHLYTREQSGEVTYIQTAVAHGIPRERLGKVTIFATPTSQERHGEELLKEFSACELPDPHLVEIPDRLDQQAIYNLFELVSEELQKGPEHIVFDLTHGYRALPALGLLIMNYVRSLKRKLIVESIVYGAWELREEGSDIAPMIELGTLWELNSWASGFDAFARSGNAEPLAKLAEEKQNQYFKSGRPGSKSGKPIPKLKNFAGRLQDWSTAIQHNCVPLLIGPDSITNTLYENYVLSDWNPVTEQLGKFILPLKEILREELEPMISKEPWDSTEGMRAQLGLIEWYTKNGMISSALTVASEWTSTLVAHVTDTESREESDEIIGAATKNEFNENKQVILSGQKVEQITLSDAQYEYLRTFVNAMASSSLLSAASSIKAVRNDLNHAYMDRTVNSPLARNKDKHGKVTGTAKKITEALAEFKATLEQLS